VILSTDAHEFEKAKRRDERHEKLSKTNIVLLKWLILSKSCPTHESRAHQGPLVGAQSLYSSQAL
jgi:hypothetical protein